MMGITCALELLGAPLLDPLELRVMCKPCLRRSHIKRFGHSPVSVVPFPGGCSQTEVQFVTLPRDAGTSGTLRGAAGTLRRGCRGVSGLRTDDCRDERLRPGLHLRR